MYKITAIPEFPPQLLPHSQKVTGRTLALGLIGQTMTKFPVEAESVPKRALREAAYDRIS